MSNAVNSLLNPDKNCATITINVSDFYALIHRIQSQDERLSRLEQIVVIDQREAMRSQLAKLEDTFQLTRTYEKRMR